MKSQDKSLLYSLKTDGEIFEYRVRNTWIKSLFDLFQLSTEIIIPVNIIQQVKTRKVLWGHFVCITIEKYSTRKKAPTSTLRLKRVWVFKKSVIQSLQNKLSALTDMGLNKQISLIDTKKSSAKHGCGEKYLSY